MASDLCDWIARMCGMDLLDGREWKSGVELDVALHLIFQRQVLKLHRPQISALQLALCRVLEAVTQEYASKDLERCIS